MEKYLVKTCWLVDGAGFEEPWPMSIYVVFFSSLTRFAGGLMIQLPQCEPLVTSRRVIERFVKFRKTLGLCKHIIHRADNLPFVSYCHHLIGPTFQASDIILL